MEILMGFAGRINRAKWWLWNIILVVVAVIIAWILAGILGVAGAMTDPALAAGSSRTMAIIQIIVLAIIGYPATALMIKRLNDRDRPSYLAYIFWAPSVLSILGNLFGLAMNPEGTNTALGLVLGLAQLVVGIWILIELGILKGTDGPNQHGPDPLAK